MTKTIHHILCLNHRVSFIQRILYITYNIRTQNHRFTSPSHVIDHNPPSFTYFIKSKSKYCFQTSSRIFPQFNIHYILSPPFDLFSLFDRFYLSLDIIQNNSLVKFGDFKL